MAHDGSNPGRTSSRTLSALLRQMFDTINAKPVPDSLLGLVDQLDGSAPEHEPEDEPPSPAERFALA